MTARILIVEDEIIVGKDIASHLEEMGYEVAGITANGEEALQLLQEGMLLDLVLMDIQLDGVLDGVDTAQEVRNKYQIPVVFLTAHSDAVTFQRAKQTEPYGYIYKPFEARDLATSIEIALYKHQSERKIRKSEALHRGILQSAMDGFWLADRQGHLLEVNDAYCKMSGYSAEELLAMSIQDVEALETVEELQKHVQIVIETGKDRFESRHRRKDGSFFDVEISVMAQEDGSFVVFLRDITERKRAEANLLLAASVFNNIREGIMITSIAGKIIDVNNAFTEITGFSRDEVVGKTPNILNSGMQKKEFYEDMWSSLKQKGAWSGEIYNRRKNCDIFPELLHISRVCDAQGNPMHYVALFTDITAIKEYQRQLEHIAHYDTLTMLPNRVLLTDRLQQAMSMVKRRGKRLAVVYIDFDEFKAINDTHGHDIGDQFLMAVATQMNHTLRRGDTLARQGGDEFIAVLVDLEMDESYELVLQRLLAAASRPFQIGDLELQLSASMGVTMYPQEEEMDIDQLLRQADKAMYQAKQQGKNTFIVFS